MTKTHLLCEMWAAFGVAFGARWTSSAGSTAITDDGDLTIAAGLWGEAFAGLKPAQVRQAVKAACMSGSGFPPTMPEFRRLAFNIPPFEDVNSELLTKPSAERSDIARLVWSRIDAHQHRHASAADARKMRVAAYDWAVERLIAGTAEIPAAPKSQIEHKAPESEIPKDRESRIARLAEILGPEFHESAARRTLAEANAQDERRDASGE